MTLLGRSLIEAGFIDLISSELAVTLTCVMGIASVGSLAESPGSWISEIRDVPKQISLRQTRSRVLKVCIPL